MAAEEHVDMRFYNIIYNVIKDVKDAIVGMMESTFEERVLGLAETREVFHVPKVGTIAGCYVTSGVITKKARLRLIRSNIVLRDNCSIESLKHFKEDVREVKAGFECGVKIAGFDDIKIDDVLEAFEIVEVARTL
jgi:translation initiation factor IF-2